MKTILAATTAALLIAPAALAQTQPAQQPAQQPGSLIPSLVTVDLRNVLNDLAVRLNLDRANVPVTAQIPINIAANVCGVSVNVLAASTGGQAACQAKTGSVQLAQSVQQQMAAGGSVAGSQGGTASGTGKGTAVGSLGGSTGSTATGGTVSSGQSSPTQVAGGAPAATGAATPTAAQAPAGAPAQTAQGAATAPAASPQAPAQGAPGAQAAQGGAPAAAAGRPATITGTIHGTITPDGQVAATTGGAANTAATAPGRGESESAPGHVKKRHGARSARAYAPGQQR